ncbi:MAG: hypothetical protein ACE5GE_12300 [Phycisphaerae bacterium]
MKKLMCLAVISALVLSGSARAEDVRKCCAKSKGKCTATSAGCSKATSKTGEAPGVCPEKLASMVDKVLGDIPRMTYVVGQTKTQCFKTAVEKAGDADKVAYLVDGKTYECKQRASDALADLLENHARKMMSVQYVVDGQCVGCPKSAAKLAAAKSAKMVYRLAGVDFDGPDKAKSAADAVRQAVMNLAASNPNAATLVKADGAGDGAAPAASGCPKSGSGCSKSKATVASGAGGCSKSNATVASGKAKKGGCPKAKAAVASAKDSSGCCSKKASTVAGTPKGCAKGAAVAAGDAKSGCCSKKAAPVAKKAGCQSAAVASKSDSKGKGTVASGIVAGGCCSKAAKTVAASTDGKSGCSKSKGAIASVVSALSGCCSKTAKASADAKTGCGAKTASACSKKCTDKCTAECIKACAKASAACAKLASGCCKSKDAAAKTTSDCCSKGQKAAADKCNGPEQRLANLQDLLRVMIETAARTRLS